ncbi:sugar ABC transporter substrate-binding protein [Treponema parvum]|uniref:Sugar ABC transporter substrate-binding protein n=1 Tax=Treponema parvum TaxID=138851 RepID=A0A975F520_9SPIR|nr:sugar ABC transporter substrate-binding protein [Treponema parvum]QTQ14840.1 sugar ABC transporter substrate-binding protein [Treponema parvum]
MPLKKTTIALVAALISAASFAQGGKSTLNTSEEKKTKDIKLAYVSMNLANPWNIAVKKGFENACKELGVQYLSIDSQYKVDKQVSDLENLINAKYDGFTFTPIDPNATKELVETAKAKGIATASIAQMQDNVNLIYTLNEYDYGYAIGKQAGEWIRDTLGGKAEVAIISQDNVEAVIPRGNGVEDAIRKICPNITIVSRQAGDTPEGGLKIIESVLQSHPSLNVVVGTNDSGAIGGYQAMVNARKSGNKYAVFSGDATSECLALMREPNSIYRGTVDLFPYKGGYESAKILYKYVTEGIPTKQEKIMLPYVPVSQEDLLSGKYIPQN